MLFAVIAAASLQARVADVRLVSAERYSAVEMKVNGTPAQVVVRRDGDLTRVSLTQTDLGAAFSGSGRFQWLWSATGATEPRKVHCPEAFWIDREGGAVTVSMRLPPEVSVEPRQAGSTIVLVFREMRAGPASMRAEVKPPAPAPTEPPAPPPPIAVETPAPTPAVTALVLPTAMPTVIPTAMPTAIPTAAPTDPPPAVPTPAPTATPSEPRADLVAQLLGTLSGSAEAPVETEPEPPTPTLPPPTAPPPAAEPGAVPSESTDERVAQLLRGLSGSNEETPGVSTDTPTTIASHAPTEGTDAESLYSRLFPHGTPAPTPPPAGPTTTVPEPARDRTLTLGNVTLEPVLQVSYMDATASLLDDTGTVHDRYLEIRPGLALATRFFGGQLRANYEPALRSFGSFSPTRSPSHRVGASLDLGAEGPFQLSVREAWAAGVLEVQEVDPGGEYFFDLQRFSRNAVGLTVHHEVAPTWTLAAGSALTHVRFDNPGAFFDHDIWTVDFGVDHEITENLHASVALVHDRVPQTLDRPEAESTAYTVRAALTGQASPFVSTQATVGYREEEHPFAGAGGEKYRGLVLGGTVTRTLGRASRLTLSASRSALLSAFEDNGFYVSNQVETSTVFSIPRGFFLDAAVGYRWNDYATVSRAIGAPRDDTLFDWRVGLRRPIGSGTIGTSYQRQRRRSNIDRFDTSTDRLILQFDFDVLRATGLR